MPTATTLPTPPQRPRQAFAADPDTDPPEPVLTIILVAIALAIVCVGVPSACYALSERQIAKRESPARRSRP
jgi:hypothetical protein